MAASTIVSRTSLAESERGRKIFTCAILQQNPRSLKPTSATGPSIKVPTLGNTWTLFLPLAVDALSISWQNHRPYMFPPFALINRCLEKVCQEKVDALLIAPVWQSQVWFPRILECLVDKEGGVIVGCRLEWAVWRWWSPFCEIENLWTSSANCYTLNHIYPWPTLETLCPWTRSIERKLFITQENGTYHWEKEKKKKTDVTKLFELLSSAN